MIYDLQNKTAIYYMPWFREIHLVGQFLDSLLIIYVLQEFFGLKHGKRVTPKTVLPVSLTFMVLLAVEDVLMQNWFWGYAALMVLFPFIYSCIFCQGRVLIKAAICLILFSLPCSLEDLCVFARYLFADGTLIYLPTLFALFFVRRVIAKGLVYLIVRWLILSLKQIRTEIRQSYWIFLTVVCIADFVLCRYNSMTFSHIDTLSPLNYLISLFSITVPIIGCYLLRQAMNLMEISKVVVAQNTMISLQKKNLAETAQIQEALRDFHHDYQAHLFCLNALLEQKDYDGLRRYLEKLQDFSPEELEITPYTANDTLNMILSQKKKEATRKGVDLSITADIEAGNETGNIDIFDLNVLLSNLCSNAVEAAAQVENGCVRLRLSRKKAYLKIETENSISHNVLEQNPDLLTSKPDKEHHGLGMRIIKNVVEKYDGILDRQSTDDMMKISILLFAD